VTPAEARVYLYRRFRESGDRGLREWRGSIAAMAECGPERLSGLPEEVLPLVGVARIMLSSDGGLWQPHEGGVQAFVTPTMSIDMEGWRQVAWSGALPEDDPWLGYLYGIEDLVAWHPNTPERWALRWGVAEMLGEAGDPEEPLRVHRTPYGWLKAGGEGVCVLRPSGYGALRLVDRLIAEDSAHRHELYKLLTHSGVPKITT
jgi:hypothetical protein